MKVKGIVTQKYDKKRNLHRGDVIEFSADEKAILAVKDAVKQSSVLGETQVWAEGIVLDGNLTTSAKGEKFHKKYTNASYKTKGTVVIRTLNVKTNKLKPAVTHKFSIEFCDCLDELNQPELKVDSFELK